MKSTKNLKEKLGNIFISDRAIDSAEFDEFGHDDYASLLEKLILEQPTPFNIGIYGKWGVGKSTIINLLRERLGNKVKFLEVKVWKYDEFSLRRKFIVNIAEGLGLGKKLDAINQEMYSDQEFETALLNIQDIIATIFNPRSIALWFLVTSFFLFIILRIVNLIELTNSYWNSAFQKFEEFIVIPLFVSIVVWIVGVIQKAKLKIKTGKYDSEEQFENKFVELVKRDSKKKIIFIDDLDRCSKEKVVKTLETIKTFLDVETCIFIIACDDEIIKAAIAKTHELYSKTSQNEESEYLEKFFQYTIRIPPFMIPDMRRYVRTVLKRNDSDLLKLEQFEDINFVLINNNVRSPRNAITSLNEFSAALLLAKQREESESSQLHQKVITNNLPLLAVITSIKIHFPEFHTDLLKNNDLIFWIKTILEGNKNQLDERQLQACAKYYLEKENEIQWDTPKNAKSARLLSFLESTKDYLTVKDIGPFLYLVIDSTSYSIGDEFLQEFNDALKNGIETKVEKILDDADNDKKVHLFDHMIYWIQEKLEGVEKRKALQILSKQFSRCPKSKLHKASRTFYRHYFNSNTKYEDYKKFSPEGIFISAKHLEDIHQKNLLSQTFDFLQGIDIEHDKLLLNEIFNNEEMIQDTEVVDKVIAFIDRRTSEGGEDETETTEFLDYEYIKNKIIEFEEKPNLISKFLSGNIVEEVTDKLLEADSEADSKKGEYDEALKVFEIVKTNILDKDLTRFAKNYEKLVKTNENFSKIIYDIKENQDKIPDEQVNSFAISLLKEVPEVTSPKMLQDVFDVIYFWFENFDWLKEESAADHLKDQILEILQNEDEDIFGLGVDLYTKFKQFISSEENSAILNQVISLVNPKIELSKSKKLSSLIVDGKSSLTKINKQKLLEKLIGDLNTVGVIRKEGCYEFWRELYSNLYSSFEDDELDILIKPNNNQNILSFSFPGANNSDRLKFCYFIIKGFEKISEVKQNEYFELFRQFFGTVNTDNAEYCVESIYPVHSLFKDEHIIPNNVALFINQISVLTDNLLKLYNAKIIYTGRDKLNQTQIDQTLASFVAGINKNPDFSIKFFLENWGDFNEENKLQTLKELLSTNTLNEDEYLNKVLEKISADLEGMEDDEVIIYMDNLEFELKETEEHRSFFARILSIMKSSLKRETIQTLKANKINEIKSESDIDLCRNKFSVIIAFKDEEYDKDNNVNDLFFSLLNGTQAKKKLALDVFEYYYDNNHPFHRKVELTERFKVLLDELSERKYKEKLIYLAKRYDLKIKKSFFEEWLGI